MHVLITARMQFVDREKNNKKQWRKEVISMPLTKPQLALSLVGLKDGQESTFELAFQLSGVEAIDWEDKVNALRMQADLAPLHLAVIGDGSTVVAGFPQEA